MLRHLIVIWTVCAATAAAAEDRFSVTLSSGLQITEATEKAKVRYAEQNLWEFKSPELTLRFSVRHKDGTSISGPKDFIHNNTLLIVDATVEGKNQKVGCKTNDAQANRVERSTLTPSRVGGTFEIAFDTCTDYYSAAPVEIVDQLPFVVKGTFDLARTD